MSLVLDQAAEILRARVAAKRKALDPAELLFEKQRTFVTDPARFKTAVCSRRAGKTIGCAFALLDSALKKPGSVSMYLTLDRTDAKTILWSAILDLNAERNLGGKPNESDLTLRLPNGSMVLLAGAGDERKIKKRRGLPCGIVIVDEAQNFSEQLKDLVRDVIEPSLMDFAGALWLVGTPNPVPVGYFYECTRNPEWSSHAWTFFDNPWIERKSGHPPQWHLDEALKHRGVTVDDPSIQREFFGRWVLDTNSLVFKYEAGRNHYDALPSTLTGVWRYVIGIDVGFDDADAIAVLAWNDQDPRTWLKREHIKAKQDITSLAVAIHEIWEDLGKDRVVSMVMDTGGVGKKVAEELSARHRLPISPAEKTEKQTHIELLNDALRTGRFLARRDSKFAEDCMLVEWDREKSTPDRRVISEKYHSDICDAVLYAFRESLAWTSKVPEQRPPEGSHEWAKAESRRLFEHAMRDVQNGKRKGDDWGVGDMEFGGGIEL